MDAVASEISLVERSSRCAIHIFTQTRFLEVTLIMGGNVFRIALRDDPDVILIGEMRDYETISLAMMAAETGHLVFGTLHTSSAAQTIDRIIDVCPIHAQVRCATSFQICFRALSRRASFRALTGMGASLRLRSCSARTR